MNTEVGRENSVFQWQIRRVEVFIESDAKRRWLIERRARL
jgi:hypothetical protein